MQSRTPINEGATRQPPTAYTRFIVLGDARTGSTLLVQSLNSHPHILCFREVFHGRVPYVDYSVEGYDNFNARDLELRKSDPAQFLRERIFTRHDEAVGAVGFKFIYGHHWDFPGIIEQLAGDSELLVIHLQRRNYVRSLVSLKLAQESGVWVDDARRPVSTHNVARAVRHPLRAAGWLSRRLTRPKHPRRDAQERAAVTITSQECYEFIVRTKIVVGNYEKLFAGHPTLALYYEDLLADRDAVLNRAQSFLAVAPRPLTATLRRQNPQPLRDLIENYDELYAAFKDSEYAALFDD